MTMSVVVWDGAVGGPLNTATATATAAPTTSSSTAGRATRVVVVERVQGCEVVLHAS